MRKGGRGRTSSPGFLSPGKNRGRAIARPEDLDRRKSPALAAFCLFAGVSALLRLTSPANRGAF